MDLQLKDKYFLVTGASQGFGRAIAMALINEGALVLANARNAEHLQSLKDSAPNQVEYIAADITSNLEQDKVLNAFAQYPLTGVVINAGGPPVMGALKTKLIDWDNAYKSVFRWKVRLATILAKKFKNNEYGRMVFIESVSVKQAVDDLVLSNAYRMAVVGYVKTLSREMETQDVNMNIMAPSYHDTHAMNRILKNISKKNNMNNAAARELIESQTLTGKMGDANDFASLALWLLSPYARMPWMAVL
ncbi:MAG: short-chain dehydrogenase [Bacteroidetes bacterium 4572_77]|nr:MAG: short-chain dehydrogenase [Bacteroidetes bacterium 4572_77]